MLLTSVTPQGRFLVGIHRPAYTVINLRHKDYPMSLGYYPDQQPVGNQTNFPEQDVHVAHARPIYEIRNPLPFRGCTYIDSGWADGRAAAPHLIRLPAPSPVSLRAVLGEHCPEQAIPHIVRQLPLSLRYGVAATSTDSQELIWLAESCCQFSYDEEGVPSGLCYQAGTREPRAIISDFELFETLANNPHLPDDYKQIMVLRPGAQGSSEIVGDYQKGKSEIFEYLRTNSYVPWGHYAANCAHTAIRYRIADLSQDDMDGLRHLYYQRMFILLAQKLDVPITIARRRLSDEELEQLRRDIVQRLLADKASVEAVATLWGWNFGYDFSGSGYRLHASHQMIHQQYAMVPQWVEETGGGQIPAYAAGDMVAEVIAQYRAEYQSDFFSDYLRAIASNRRTDGGEGAQSLVIWQDENVLLFVPKAQVSQWEIQLVVTADSDQGPIGTVIEANTAVRQSLDRGILKAQQVLAGLGATMVSSIEYSKRIGLANGQRLLYSFLPKLPWSMGAFSEAQGRFILGHYPEDFAAACRLQQP